MLKTQSGMVELLAVDFEGWEARDLRYGGLLSVEFFLFFLIAILVLSCIVTSGNEMVSFPLTLESIRQCKLQM